MFSLFRVVVGHMLSSTTRLSRQIRHHMQAIVDIVQSGELQTVSQELEEATRAHDAELVQQKFERLQELVMKMGLLELLKLETDLIAMEERFEKIGTQEGIFRYLQRLEQEPGLSDAQKNLIRHGIAKYEETCERVFESLQRQYQVSVVQNREEKEHYFVLRARGIATLAVAMHDVYLLRKQRPELAHDVEEIEQREEKLINLLEDFQKKLEERETSEKKLQRTNVELSKVGKELQKMSEEEAKEFEHWESEMDLFTAHLDAVFDEFAHIMSVFGEYFFKLLDFQKALCDYLTRLENEGYPRKKQRDIKGLLELRKQQHELDEELNAKTKEAMDADARMGRLMQVIIGRAKSLK